MDDRKHGPLEPPEDDCDNGRELDDENFEWEDVEDRKPVEADSGHV